MSHKGRDKGKHHPNRDRIFAEPGQGRGRAGTIDRDLERRVAKQIKRTEAYLDPIDLRNAQQAQQDQAEGKE